jgi:hypothetical protein
MTSLNSFSQTSATNERKEFLRESVISMDFKTFVNYVRGPDKSVRRCGSGPRTIVWRDLV